jgi:hypothetical protein
MLSSVSLKDRKLLVLTNFSNQVVDFELLTDFANSEILVNNYATYTPIINYNLIKRLLLSSNNT